MAWLELVDRLARATVAGPTVGRPVAYTTGDGATTQIAGDFDAAFESVEMGGGVPVSSVQPMLEIRVADLPVPPAPDDTFVLVETGAKYIVIDVNPGASGVMVKLFAHLAPS